MIHVHGLKSCDTCRKARAWLDGAGIAHAFHDLRSGGLERITVERWLAALGPDRLINRRGTTWRGLGETERADAEGGDAAGLVLAHPALVKRPVFELGATVMVGFGEAERAALRAAG